MDCWDSIQLLWAVAAGPRRTGREGVQRGPAKPSEGGEPPSGHAQLVPGFSGEASLHLALTLMPSPGTLRCLRAPPALLPGLQGPQGQPAPGNFPAAHRAVDLGQLFPDTYFRGVCLPTTTTLLLKCYLPHPSLVPPEGCGEAQPSPWCSQGYGDKSWGIVTSIRSQLAGRFRAAGKIICCSISNGLEMDLKGKFMPPITKARKRAVLGTAPALAFIIHA